MYLSIVIIKLERVEFHTSSMNITRLVYFFGELTGEIVDARCKGVMRALISSQWI